MLKNKRVMLSAMENLRPLCESTAEALWNQPELGGTEQHASDLFRKLLSEEGFRIVNEPKLPYAFYGEYGSGSPVIAVLGEYDALPGLSQKCQITREPVTPGGKQRSCPERCAFTAAPRRSSSPAR